MVFKTSFVSVEDGKPVSEEKSAKPKRQAPVRDLNWIIALGAIEVVMGCASIAVASAGYVITKQTIETEPCFFTRIGQGIWTGGLLVITGMLGLVVKYHPTVFMYSLNVGFGAVVALLHIPGLLISATGCDDRDNIDTIRILYAVLVFHGLLACVSTITHSICSCSSIFELTEPEYPDEVLYGTAGDEDSSDKDTKDKLTSIPYSFVPPKGEHVRQPHLLSSYMMKKKANDV